MKKHVTILAISLIAVVAVAAYAQDEELEVSFSVDAAVLNKYVWRGLTLTDGFVFQPAATIAAGGFSFNVWGNMDLEDVNDNEFQFNEVDITGDYTLELEGLSISAGVIHYQFPNTDFDSTTEFYASLSLDTVLAPTVTWYQDIDLVEGTYINFGVSHEIPLEQTGFALGLFANLGWGSEEHNAFYYGVEESAFTDFIAGGSLSIPLSESIVLTPSLAYSNLVDENINDMFEEPDQVLFGVAVSLGF